MADNNGILIAVNDSDSTRNAVEYVGRMAGCRAGVRACLLHVYPSPPPHHFKENYTLNDYVKEKEAVANRIFAEFTDTLKSYAIPPENISSICRMTKGETTSEAILKTREAGDYGTIVLGRRGISKAEEFLFGSISNTVVQQCTGFAVWIIG